MEWVEIDMFMLFLNKIWGFFIIIAQISCLNSIKLIPGRSFFRQICEKISIINYSVRIPIQLYINYLILNKISSILIPILLIKNVIFSDFPKKTHFPAPLRFIKRER